MSDKVSFGTWAFHVACLLILVLCVFAIVCGCGVSFGDVPPPPTEQSTSPDSQQDDVKRDYRRVIVAVYHMPGSDPHATSGLFGRRRQAVCPACEVAKEDEPRLMEARPDVWWGISGDGMSPSKVITFNGEHRHYKPNKARIESYPLFVIYSGTPGSWGSERYRLIGYRKSDFDKLIQMIDWAAEY